MVLKRETLVKGRETLVCIRKTSSREIVSRDINGGSEGHAPTLSITPRKKKLEQWCQSQTLHTGENLARIAANTRTCTFNMVLSRTGMRHLAWRCAVSRGRLQKRFVVRGTRKGTTLRVIRRSSLCVQSDTGRTRPHRMRLSRLNSRRERVKETAA